MGRRAAGCVVAGLKGWEDVSDGREGFEKGDPLNILSFSGGVVTSLRGSRGKGIARA